MSFIPLKPIAGLSAIGSYSLVHFAPHMLLSSTPSLIGTFVQLAFVQLLVWAFYRVILYPKYLSPLRHFPGPKEGNSFFHGQWAKIRAEPTGRPAKEWVNTIPNDGIIRYLFMFNSERLLLTSPKALSDVLTVNSYDFKKPFHVRAGLGRVLGVGVLLAEEDEHKHQRKHLLPAFAFRHVKNLYPVFWGKSKEAALAMSSFITANLGKTESEIAEKAPASDQAIVEIQGWASRATLDIIGVAGMGKDFGSIADENVELYKTYRTIFKPNKQAQVLAMLNLFLPRWITYRIPLKRNGEIEEAVGVIRGVARGLVRHKKEQLEKNQLSDVDILSVAMESGIFTEEQLLDQMMTFLAAGHETTASALTWSIYGLCLRPEMQTRLRAEIRERLPSLDSDTPITNNDIDGMPFLNAVVNEVLRYYAPVPMTLRVAARPTQILGHHIPEGTSIMITPAATNRDKSLWGDDADDFNPDRWLDNGAQNKNGGATSNYSMLTFLHGPRSCIAKDFSKAEFACLVAAIVGKMEFELQDKAEMDEKNMLIKGGVTDRPAKGLWVKARVVDGW